MREPSIRAPRPARPRSPALLFLLLLLTMAGCKGELGKGASATCVGPYCDLSCDANVNCPVGSWCENGQCTTGSGGGACVDPDEDGFCECCERGTDCPDGEGDARVHPGADEACDGVDTDCDGDEDPAGCYVNSTGSGGDEPFDPGSSSGGIEQNPDGSLTLGSTDVATDFAWPSNDREGTVSRIDTILNVEVGRYASVLRIAGGNPADPGGIPPVSEWDSGCNRPSRSTVDLNGNAYVANRAHEGGCASQQGSVTKIGFFDEALCSMSLALCECVDRDGNGSIETSRDLDGDGIISLTPADGEFHGYADECLLWTVPVGANNSNTRAMAIDAQGYVWVGDWQNSKFYKLSPVDGSLVNPADSSLPATGAGIDVAGQPYGAVIDSYGWLYYVHTYNTGSVQRLDTTTGAVEPLVTTNPVGGYGITIDRNDRVWLASYDDDLGGGTVARYEPNGGTWQTFSAGLSGNAWRGRGLSATAGGMTDTEAGVVWVAFHDGGGAHLVGFDDDTGAVWDSVDLAAECGASTAIGVGVGTGGSIWAVNQASDNVCRYDPSTGAVTEIRIGNAPYTYSDFTGNILRTFTSPQGSYRTVFQGCPDPNDNVKWTAVTWNAGTPGSTAIEVRVRNAATASELSTATVHGPATQPPDRWYDLSPLNLDGALLEVEVILHGDDDGNVPTLFSVDVARTCFGDPV